MDAASASASPGAKSIASAPLPTTWGSAPARAQITGSPAWSASVATMP
jgi:hypothetical protein